MKTKTSTQKFYLKTVIIFTLFSIVFPSYMEAQIEFTPSNFTIVLRSNTGFLHNPTGTNPNRYRLTNYTYQHVAMWHNTQIDLLDEHTFYFKMYFGDSTKSGRISDGIAFAMHQLPTAGLIGGSDMVGQDMAYGGIKPSFAIEFDTWNNSSIEPGNFDHIAYLKDGNMKYLIYSRIQDAYAKVGNNQWYEIKIEWKRTNGQNGNAGYDLITSTVENVTGVLVERLKMHFPKLSDLVSTASPTNSRITWGITSACGASTNVQEIEFLGVVEPPPDTCTLILIDIDGNGKIIETKYECGNKVEINISLTDTCCKKFIHWIDNFGKIISTKPQDTITLNSDSVLIAIYEKIDFVTYTVFANPPEANDAFPYTYANVSCRANVNYGNMMETTFANDGWEFIGWSVEPNDENVFINDTIDIKITPVCKDYTITAHYKKIELPPVLDVKFYIRASKHPLTDPTRRNYRVPIFIKADEDVSGTMIDSLVIEIDRRIFYPKRVDNGDMSLHFKDTVIKMTFENVTVPELKANEEKVLLTIRGDVLLGEIDSSEIKIDTVKFAEDLSEEPELIHGFITLDICAEGANRLVWFDYSPEVIVKNNPVTGGVLELQCKTIERGSYSLEIVDMLGKSETVREFTVSANGKRIFDFEIPISNFSSGAYFIIMNTPSAKNSTKFVIQ